MAYTNYVKLRILHHPFQSLKLYTIAKEFQKEGIGVSRFGVHKFLIMYAETGSTTRRPGSGRLSVITSCVKQVVEEQMQQDDETTVYQVHRMLVEKGVQTSLGCVYCQTIREESKVKRLQYICPAIQGGQLR